MNSELKDNYGGKFIRVRDYAKVLAHLMFEIIAITAKQLYDLLCWTSRKVFERSGIRKRTGESRRKRTDKSMAFSGIRGDF